MRGKSALLRLPMLFAIMALTVAVAGAQSALNPVMTSHVPEAVASGLAPMVGHLPAQQRMSLALSLPLRNQQQLEFFLQDLYNPHSPSYHHYLTPAQFADLYGATSDDYNAVIQFAQANHLKVVGKGANRLVVDVEGAVSDVEAAFHTSIAVYQHPTEARTFYAPEREPLAAANVSLLHITGLDNFVLPVAKNSVSPIILAKSSGSGPSGSFLGSDLRAAYYGSGSLNGAGQTLAVFAYKGYNPTDINTYFANAHQTLNVPIKSISVNGASTVCNSGCTDVEQALDIEQAISMAPGLSQLRLYVGKNDVSIFNQMASDNVASSISCSYGWAKDESSLDPIFEEMAAQGQTVFVATGDNGSNTAANVMWPSDDPWVTAVGGTVLTTNGPGGSWKSETGWFNSTGTPSKNNVPIPSYQQLSGVVTSSNHASSTLRNIPDISSESAAAQYMCANGTCRNYGAGTSYAAPLWAGLIAMANQQAASRGDGPVGFLNPTLYGTATGSGFGSDFHDITSGSNGAYSAVKGYDLVTGWGSPIGVSLINALAP